MQNDSHAVRSILIVDDDRLILSTLSSSLRRAGYLVDTVESVSEAEAWLDNNEWPDLVLLDVRMPERSGLELTSCLSAHNQTPFVLLTAYSEPKIIEEASATGAMGYLVKPVDTNQLIPTIETAISRAQELQNLRRTKQQLQMALEADRAVSVAVGIVMDQMSMTHDVAFEALRDLARAQQLKMVDMASRIINARETLNLKAGV